MRNQDPQVETGALPNSKKKAFNWSAQSAFFSLFFLSAPVLVPPVLSMYPPALACRRPAIHSTHTSRQRKQPALLKNKDTLCTHQAACYKNG